MDTLVHRVKRVTRAKCGLPCYKGYITGYQQIVYRIYDRLHVSG